VHDHYGDRARRDVYGSGGGAREAPDALRLANPGAGGTTQLARSALGARRRLGAAPAGAGATADHRGTNGASRARPKDRPRRAPVATRQAPWAAERKHGLDQATGDGLFSDELAARRQYIQAAGDDLPLRPPSWSLQGHRRQSFDTDSSRPVLRRGSDPLAGRCGRGAVRACPECPLERAAGVRRWPGPDRPPRPKQRRRHARHCGLPRLRAPGQRRDAVARSPHWRRRTGNHHSVSACGGNA
jgi:hypothetical protein